MRKCEKFIAFDFYYQMIIMLLACPAMHYLLCI